MSGRRESKAVSTDTGRSCDHSESLLFPRFFHPKFKQITTMTPIQFVKSMRLNNAAMKIAGGMAVNEAAMDVGYVSPLQFTVSSNACIGSRHGNGVKRNSYQWVLVEPSQAYQ
ncbi:hypothetical protein [Ruegeria sp. Ofav3-42]|uniref:helix-turn-helix domain-containing protein n=1 Tax=Ruegeria sp. Ofav3-42 TaxID=2917759 RepID=UPI001EF688B1|nr:hypothetical protein [Ruegeria sp. Ofav3-42]MCG7522516.1 hypothetical protein [Ruegeria sp. Ofav3-42]